MPARHVSVILPTNGKAHLLREVLDALFAQEQVDVELILVLNGVNPEIEQILAHYGDRCRLVKNDRNVGFAPAMNQGAKVATGRYIYLSANDIVLPPAYLRTLADAAEAAGGWGLSSGVWYSHDEPEHRVGAGGRLRFTPSARAEILVDPPRADQPCDVDWIAGASIFTTRAAWQALGGFREEFFAHFEDIELCLRARRAGGYVRVVPAAKLYHHEHARGISSNHAIEYYKLRNYAAVNMLYGSVGGWLWTAPKYLAYTVPRIAITLGSPGFYLRTVAGTAAQVPGWLRERITRRPLDVPIETEGTKQFIET